MFLQGICRLRSKGFAMLVSPGCTLYLVHF